MTYVNRRSFAGLVFGELNFRAARERSAGINSNFGAPRSLHVDRRSEQNRLLAIEQQEPSLLVVKQRSIVYTVNWPTEVKQN